MAKRSQMGRVGTMLALFLLLTALVAPTAQAKSWEIPEALIDLRLESDGSLLVTEHRTFQFSGEYTHVYQKFDLWKQSKITEIALEGPDGPYSQAKNKAPGTYTWNGKQIDWYFRAVDTTQTFTLTYRVTNAIAMHDDLAELHWQAIGSKWDKGTDWAEVLIHLPATPVEGWVTDDNGEISVEGNLVRVVRSRLPSEKALEVRLFLPKEAVAGSTLPSDGKTLDQILKRAGRIPDPVSQTLHYGWAALTLLASFWFYRLHVVRPRVQPGPSPEPLHPVLVARLLGSQPTDALRAALADLATAGAIRIEPEGDDWRFTRVPGAAVGPWEQPALRVIFHRNQDSITLTEWKQGPGKQTTTFQILTSWWNDLQKELPERWFLPYRWWGWLLTFTVVPLLVLTTPGPSMVAPGLAALWLFGFSLAQRRYSDEGEQARQDWMAEKARLAEHELTPGDVSLALAVGLSLDEMLDPTLAIGQQFAWLQQTQMVLNSSYDSFSSSGGGGGGSAGGNGGGGGGAS